MTTREQDENQCANAFEATKHIGAKPGEIAETVLLPGDPKRAAYIAHNFLDDVKEVTSIRNMLGFTGTYKGKRISVMGTGMGCPSISIYVQELVSHYKVKKLIRIGSCGSLIVPKIKIGDLVVVMSAGTDSNMNRRRLLNMDHAPCADWGLLRTCVDILDGKTAGFDEKNFQDGAAPKQEEGKPAYHVTKVFTSDFFYHPNELELYPLLKKFGYAAIEMECSALYALGSDFGVRVLAVCSVTDEITIPDNLGKGGELSFKGMPAEQRECSLRDMVVTALETGINCL